jgi:hypothetical protein
MALPLTRASAIFLCADSRTRWKVGCDTFMVAAAFSWSSPSKSFNLTASSSSTAKLTLSSTISGIPLGLKKVTDGSQQTHLDFFGLGTCLTPTSVYMAVWIGITDILGFTHSSHLEGSLSFSRKGLSQSTSIILSRILIGTAFSRVRVRWQYRLASSMHLLSPSSLLFFASANMVASMPASL